MRRGDLLLVPYPFTDLTGSQRRPVLALTSPDAFGDFVALPVTSRPHRENAIPIAPGELLQGTVPAASWVRTDRVVTLHLDLVLKTFGRVSEQLRLDAAEAVCRFIGHTQSGLPGTVI